MAFISTTHRLGVLNLTAVENDNPGVGILPRPPLAAQPGEIVTGTDENLGSGEFIYLKGVANLVAGDVVTYNALTGVVTRWDGTANSGRPLAVAVAAPTASQWGWFQIAGNAVVNCTGTVAAGDAVFYGATAAIVRTASNNGRQVLGAVAASANNATIGGVAIGSTKAVYTINRPHVQGIIT